MTARIRLTIYESKLPTLTSIVKRSLALDLGSSDAIGHSTSYNASAMIKPLGQIIFPPLFFAVVETNLQHQSSYLPVYAFATPSGLNCGNSIGSLHSTKRNPSTTAATTGTFTLPPSSLKSWSVSLLMSWCRSSFALAHLAIRSGLSRQQ